VLSFLEVSFRSGVTSLKSYVTPDILKRLMDFPYMKTEEDLAHFTSWIGTLNIKKVRGTLKNLVPTEAYF
jgi:hypothetical protein